MHVCSEDGFSKFNARKVFLHIVLVQEKRREEESKKVLLGHTYLISCFLDPPTVVLNHPPKKKTNLIKTQARDLRTCAYDARAIQASYI